MNAYLKNLKKQTTRKMIFTKNDNSLIKQRLPKYTFSIDKIEDLGQVNGKYLKNVTYTSYSNISYEKLVNELVKQRYSDSQEFSILRKAITNGVNEEYQEYNLYVEECKYKAKKFIKERELLGILHE